jgi:hypothetical protein
MPRCGLQGIELIQHQRRYGAPNILQIGVSVQLARDFVYFLHGPVFLNTGCVSVNGTTTDVILKGIDALHAAILVKAIRSIGCCFRSLD